jgi:hypothetical protein
MTQTPIPTPRGYSLSLISPSNPKFNLLHGRRSIWFPSLSFGVLARMGIAFLLARAVAVVGNDFALSLLQVQRGKHMGFSRYFLLVPYACCSLPCLYLFPCSTYAARSSCFHVQACSWALALQKLNCQSRFCCFSDATVDLCRIVGFGRYNKFSCLLLCSVKQAC